jgi:hypothetical protein
MLNKAPTSAVTVLTATDLHQNRQLYADLRKAVVEHQPDIVAIVGDCLHAGEDNVVHRAILTVMRMDSGCGIKLRFATNWIAWIIP